MANESPRMVSKKIGFIGGGNMATALIRGLLAAGTVVKAHVRATDVKREQLANLEQQFGIQTGTDNEELARWADVIVLAVKPQILSKVLPPLKGALKEGALIVSIAAGVSIAALEAPLATGTRVLRAMPNTAATALAAATAIARGAHATDEDLAIGRALFDSVGRTVVVDEGQLDAVTGLSGSGPAYVMLIIEALADGGVKMGLPRDTALLLAAQTVYGAAKLQIETSEHPAKLKDMVTSPGGTTIAGLHKLEAGGLRRAMMDAVEAAAQRSSELGALMAKKG